MERRQWRRPSALSWRHPLDFERQRVDDLELPREPHDDDRGHDINQLYDQYPDDIYVTGIDDHDQRGDDINEHTDNIDHAASLDNDRVVNDDLDAVYQQQYGTDDQYRAAHHHHDDCGDDCGAKHIQRAVDQLHNRPDNDDAGPDDDHTVQPTIDNYDRAIADHRPWFHLAIDHDRADEWSNYLDRARIVYDAAARVLGADVSTALDAATVRFLNQQHTTYTDHLAALRAAYVDAHAMHHSDLYGTNLIAARDALCAALRRATPNGG